ncbi:hypothetical protein GCM10010371_68250 [Streptomyces subrutilus]|uniref:Uncharacterized protein n=1 Tax=Streptomyces subrutilus TaxID=36818 RepID=A0A5P2UD13_9ACTN|nr:DUF5819 family protein [Streptomyces subrutilus]QEU77163.1 hypothetical protein CP968_01575 [Streptomyces subrutilus]WSJ34411.1 DUF5819 family protein [Streptomyces subrutilus]GGZ99076.1 hypothetical protein GCM10010371_68250 [Streptomyces subrutilus]
MLAVALRTAVVLSLLTTATHVLMLFLHVAPANSVSNRFGPQINAWVYPLFEQNWRLFAPEPDSVNRRILARTAQTTPGGPVRVSAWSDLSAVDHSAVRHNAFPSHTAQNLLRRAWTSYVETHGGNDGADSERAVMMQTYLRNIAVDRVKAHTEANTIDFIQLRVLTKPIAAPGAAAGHRPPGPPDERLLPWWKVTSP